MSLGSILQGEIVAPPNEYPVLNTSHPVTWGTSHTKRITVVLPRLRLQISPSPLVSESRPSNGPPSNPLHPCVSTSEAKNDMNLKDCLSQGSSCIHNTHSCCPGEEGLQEHPESPHQGMGSHCDWPSYRSSFTVSV